MAISDTQYQAWLASPSEERTLLVEASYFDGSNGVEYISNRGHITKPTDTDANREYEDVILSFPVFRRSMSEVFGGKTQQSYGDIEIANEDGVRDDWLDRSWNGRDIVLKFGAPDWDYSDFRVIMSGTVAELTVKNINTLVLKLRDKGVYLEKQIQESVFGSGPSINRTIPLCYGQVFKIAPVLEDEVTHKYKIHDGEISSIDAVYDKGVSVSFTADLADGSFTLASQPAGQITADVKGAVIESIGSAPVATNLLTYSEQFDHGIWIKGNATVTANSGVAPDGSSTADLLVETTASNTHSTYQTANVTALVPYVFSVFAQQGVGDRRLQLILSGAAIPTNAYANFNLDTGVATANGVCTAEMVAYPNGWYRCDITATPTVVASMNSWCRLHNTDTAAWGTYTGDGSSGILLWGAQLEQSSIGVTEYIPTEATTVTRSLENYRDDLASIAWDIIKNRSDLVAEDIDEGNFSEFRITHPQVTGVFVDNKNKTSQVLDKLFTSLGGFWGFNREGRVTVGQLIDPENETPTLTMTSDDIVEGGMLIKSRQLPKFKISLGYMPYAKTQGANDVAGSITEDEIADLVQSYRIATAVDSTVRNAHLLSTESGILPTQLVDSTEATTEASRRLVLNDTIATTYIIDAFATPLTINLGDIIEIDHDRFGFDGGSNAVVVAYSESVTPPRMKLEVWKKSVKHLPATFGFFGTVDTKGFGTTKDFSEGGIWDSLT